MNRPSISAIIVIIAIIVLGLYAAGEVNYYAHKNVSQKDITSPVIMIDKVGINEKINNKSLDLGVMLDEKSGIPTHGDVIIFGHRTLQGSPFLRLNELEKGDAITLEWPGIGEVHYTVINKTIVPATYQLNTNESGDHVLLITCDPIGSTTEKDKWLAYYNICVANAWTVKLCREIDKDAQVGCMLTCSSVATYPYDCNPDNVFGAYNTVRLNNFYFGDVFCLGEIPGYVKRVWREHDCAPEMREDELQLIKENTVAFFSFSYYRSSTYDQSVGMDGNTGGLKGRANPFVKECSPEPWCWPVDPKGIRYVMNILYDRYHLPLFIVENGIGLDENLDETGHIHDEYRMYYIKEHLKYVHEAILDGVECMGYLYWGPIDVVSAGTGEMKKRYGFVYVDRLNDGHGTLERKLKDSYEEYKEIIETNGDSILHS